MVVGVGLGVGIWGLGFGGFSFFIFILFFFWFGFYMGLFGLLIFEKEHKEMMILSLILLPTCTSLFVGFSTTFQASSFVSTKCTGYVGQYFCAGYNSTGSASQTIIQYNRFQPNTSLYTNIYNIHEMLTANGMVSSYSNPPYFISDSANGGVYSIDLVANTAQLLFQNAYSTYTNVMVREDKSSIPKFYYFLIMSYSPTNYTTEICQKILPNPTCTTLLTLPSQVVAATVNEHNTIIILHVDNALNTTTLSLIYPNGTIYANLTKNVKGTKNFLVSSVGYVGFAINGFIYGYDVAALGQVWSYMITIPKRVKQLSLMYPWLISYDQNNKVMQFNIITGKLFDTFAPTSIYQYSMITFNSAAQEYKLYLFIVNDTLTYQTVLSDQYITGNGSCLAGYTLTGVNCKAVVPTTIMSVINFTAPAPTPNITVNSTTNTTTTTTTTTTTSTSISPTTSSPQSPDLCSQRCDECTQSRLNCISCSQYYFKYDQGPGYCFMDKQMSIISLIYAISNTFKNRKTLAFYAYIQNFQLYQYHRVRYRSILEIMLNFTRFVTEKEWELVKLNLIQDKFDSFWFVGVQYTPMTSTDYLLIQRKDLTFIQNTKQYLFLFIPTTTVLFLLLNRLSNCLKSTKLGKMLTNFSFWVYLCIIIIFNDTQRFSYLAVMQLSNLAHFRFFSLVLQAASVGVIGLWVVCCFGVYFMCGGKRRGKREIDLGNWNRSFSGLVSITLRYAVKPILMGAIHSLTHSNHPLQILLLLSTQLTSFLLTALNQIGKKTIKTKIIFSIQCLLDLLAALVNVLIYIKFIYLLKSVQTGTSENLREGYQVDCVQVVEDCIGVVAYGSTGLVGLGVLIGGCQLVKEFFTGDKVPTPNTKPPNSRKASVKSTGKRKSTIKKPDQVVTERPKKKKKQIFKFETNKKQLIKVERLGFKKLESQSNTAKSRIKL